MNSKRMQRARKERRKYERDRDARQEVQHALIVPAASPRPADPMREDVSRFLGDEIRAIHRMRRR